MYEWQDALESDEPSLYHVLMFHQFFPPQQSTYQEHYAASDVRCTGVALGIAETP